jgi:nicotinic acid mononucleotide adenylyltransferase
MESFPSGFAGQWLKGIPVDISSSNIRGRVKAGLSIRGLVPDIVSEAIKNNRLYL